jgi:hypothetical protein
MIDAIDVIDVIDVRACLPGFARNSHLTPGPSPQRFAPRRGEFQIWNGALFPLSAAFYAGERGPGGEVRKGCDCLMDTL